MAGSDKKERKLASGEPTFGGTQPLVVQDPDVSHFVMTGNPTGLIPRAALNADQKTTITAWNGALPPNGVHSMYLISSSAFWAVATIVFVGREGRDRVISAPINTTG
jgi:hypothetical protein